MNGKFDQNRSLFPTAVELESIVFQVFTIFQSQFSISILFALTHLRPMLPSIDWFLYGGSTDIKLINHCAVQKDL